MKKSLILFFVLFVSAVCFLTAFQSSLLKEKDNVQFRDEILLGDAEDADGITVDIHTQYNRHLFWDTTYQAGENPVVSTDYSFYPSEKRAVHKTGESVHMNADIESYHFLPDTPRSKLKGIDQAFYDLYHDDSPVLSQESTANDNTKVKTIYLKDYYDYYPLYMGIYLENYSWGWNWSDQEYYLTEVDTADDYTANYIFLRDYFRIPIIEDDTRMIQLDTYYDSYSTMVSYSDEPPYFMDSYSAVTKDALYFFFSFSNNGEPVDWDSSLLPDGYGIYRIPYETIPAKASGTRPKQNVDVKALDMVFPLDKNIEVFHFTTTEDKSKLLLAYRDSNTPDTCTQLAVIDAETAKLLQTITLEGIDKPDGSTEILIPYTIHVYDDFIALYCSSDYLVVLDLEPSGLYRLDCIIDIHQNPIFDYYIDSRGIVVMDRKDDKIAITGLKKKEISEDRYYDESCGFYLAIFNRDGLVYYSVHDSSLDWWQLPYGNQSVTPLSYYNDEKPLSISWE